MRLQCGCVMPLELCPEGERLREAVSLAYARHIRENTPGSKLSHQSAVRVFLAHKLGPKEVVVEDDGGTINGTKPPPEAG